MITREQGEEKAKDASDDIIYKIDVPSNRYNIYIGVYDYNHNYYMPVCICTYACNVSSL